MPSSSRPALRFRLLLDPDHAIGPGKIDLLEAISTTGSISAAARSMEMSYKRAWQLVDELNHSFASALVVASRGGGHGGGAELTATGRIVLDTYREIEQRAQTLLARELRKLARLQMKS